MISTREAIIKCERTMGEEEIPLLMAAVHYALGRILSGLKCHTN